MREKSHSMWCVYIVRCSNSALYTGITTDLTRRLQDHNKKKGGKYTRSYTPVNLVYKECCLSKSKALKREAQIKSWTRKEKMALIP